MQKCVYLSNRLKCLSHDYLDKLVTGNIKTYNLKNIWTNITCGNIHVYTSLMFGKMTLLGQCWFHPASHRWFKITELRDDPSEILSSWYHWSVWWWLWCILFHYLPSETKTSELRFQRMSLRPGKRQESFCFHPADLQTEEYVPFLNIYTIIIGSGEKKCASQSLFCSWRVSCA